MRTVAEKIVIRLYSGQDNDLIQWIRQFDMPGTPHGAKTRAAKKALRRGMQEPEETATPDLDLDEIRQIVREEMTRVTPSLDQGAVRRAVQEAMRSTAQEGDSLDFTLSDIRQVVSVVLDQKFDRLDIAVGKKPRAETDADDKAKAERDLNHLIESLKAF